MSMRSIYLCLALLLGTVVQGAAQTVWQAVVLEEKKCSPVVDAVVACYDDRGQHLGSLVTDSTGLFTIKEYQEVAYFVIKHWDMLPRVIARASTSVDTILMTPRPLVLCNGVMTFARPKVDKWEKMRIDDIDLDQESDDILSLVARLPGLVVRDGNLVTEKEAKLSIYLDGRQLEGVEELRMIAPRHIKGMAFNANTPGSAFGSFKGFAKLILNTE